MIFKKNKYFTVIILGFIFLLPGIINAKNNTKTKGKISKVAAAPTSQVANQRMDINNLNALESNIGYADYNLNPNDEGTEFPKGSHDNAVFEGGFLWGGYANGDYTQVRVGGSSYSTGIQPGPILSNGLAADPSDPRWSIYRVRPDVYPGGPSVDLTSDVAAYVEGGQTTTTSAELLAQYLSDWTNWPAHGSTVGAPDLGAPFTDIKGDGNYDPTVDIPGVPGAAQTCYYVANDMDTLTCEGLYGALPLGFEVHVTFWAYAEQGALGNMYFKKWEIINKGIQHNVVDSMYVSYWTDVDLGSATDDVVGCDTALSMSFTYNGEATDAVYAPLPPPADGFTFFQGPIIAGNASDQAIFIEPPFQFTRIPGKKNMPMTAAYYFINTTDPNYGDPPFGNPLGSTYFYNFFKGEYGASGVEFLDPITNTPSPFAYSGDPVTNTGWLDKSPADKRQGMASGPFTFNPGDTQQVVVAEMFAGAIPSVNYLQAVALVKTYDLTAQSAYDHFFNLPGPPPPPQVIATALNDKVTLDWGEVPSAVAATENSVIHDVLDSVNASGGGSYKFEGYNVYQLPYSGASISEAVRVATYDLIDSVLNIPYVDLNTRQLNPSYYVEYGTDSGIKRFFIDSTDAFNANEPLHNGTIYYFAVTAYSYNPKGVPEALEDPISQIAVTPQSNNPGVSTAMVGPLPSSNVVHSGTANASVVVNVVNPPQITGDKYQVTFHNEMYSLGSSGTWTDITAASKKLAKIKDLTGSYLTNTAVYSETPGRIDINYIVNVISSNYDFCDGVILTLPAGVVIDTIISPVSNNTSYTGAIPYTYISKNSIFFGDSLRTGNGIFAGGEDIVLICNTPNLPMQTNYYMFDDDFSVENPQDSIGGINKDISSSDTLTTIANQLVTQNQWNVTDVTTGNIVLQNQTIYNGVDIYDPATYFKANNIYGPGGSSHPNGGIDIGPGAVNFAGIQVAVNGSFAAPTTIGKVYLNGTELTFGSDEWTDPNTYYTVSDFTDFGDPATAYGTLSIYNGGVTVGATDINDLQQSYELRWTGVTGDTTINGKTVVITKSGGSYATLFAAHNYSLASDPLNPNQGSTNPFLVGFHSRFGIWIKMNKLTCWFMIEKDMILQVVLWFGIH